MQTTILISRKNDNPQANENTPVNAVARQSRLRPNPSCRDDGGGPSGSVPRSYNVGIGGDARDTTS